MVRADELPRRGAEVRLRTVRAGIDLEVEATVNSYHGTTDNDLRDEVYLRCDDDAFNQPTSGCAVLCIEAFRKALIE